MISVNERKPEEIGAKLTTLFRSAKEELQKVQETTPVPNLSLKSRLTEPLIPFSFSDALLWV